MEKEGNAGRRQTLDKAIYMFYDWGMRHVPVCMMLWHCGDVLYSRNDAGIAYMIPMFFLLPLSYFYRLCWLWRIPFVYALGIVAVRLCYCLHHDANGVYGAYCAMIVLAALLYVYYCVKRLCIHFAERHK